MLTKIYESIVKFSASGVEYEYFVIMDITYID